MTNSNNIGSYFTPLNDFEENCERTDATLRIYSEEITPLQVTELLGVAPTSSVTKGQRIPTKVFDEFRLGKVNGWFLSSEGVVQSKDLRRHLDWLLDRLDGSAEGMRKLQQRQGVRMCVYCIWWSKYGGGGPNLWPEQMRRLADLNLECCFDFQHYGVEQGENSEQP